MDLIDKKGTPTWYYTFLSIFSFNLLGFNPYSNMLKHFMAFTEIINLKQGNEFCCQFEMGVIPHPSIFSKDNIFGGWDVKVYFMPFPFIFYNFVEIYKVVLVLQ